MTNYPAKIDTSQSLPSVIDNQTPVQGIIFNRLRDTIIDIEEELGIEPSGIYGSVAARLNVLENITGNLQIIELHNDLGGTLENPLVIGLRGNPISDVSPQVNDVLIWNGIAWEPSDAIVGLPPSGAAGGDLGSSYPDPTVVKIQGRSISVSAPANGDVLTYSTISNQWAPASLPPGFTAGGDLSGTSTSQQVISLTGSAGKINIASSGNVITWNSATTSPGITQASIATAGGTGQTISISGQSVTGTGTTTSGGLSFSSGTNTGSTTGNIGNILFTCPTPVGTGTYGNFQFDTGAAVSTLTIARNPGVQGNVINTNGQFLYIQSSIQTNLQSPGVVLGNGYTLSYNGSTSNITLTGFGAATAIQLGFTDDATPSRTGANIVLQGQNETGTTSIGGNVVLTPGTGTSSNGIVQINGNTNIPNANYIEFGSHSTAATTGYIHTQNGQVDQVLIAARNPTNTLDVPVLQYLGSLLILGGTDAGNISTFADTRVRGAQVTIENSTTQFGVNGTTIRTAFATGFNGIFNGNAPFVFDSSDNTVSDWAFKINTSRHFNIHNTGVVTIDNLSTGLVHADSTGNLTSSLLVNADVSATAAIAGTKISPAFGAQAITNSSTISVGSTTGTNTFTGSLTQTTRTITGNLTVDTTTTDCIIFIDTTSTAITVTLPAPTNGRTLFFIDKANTFATHNLTIAQHSTEKINGVAASLVISAAGWRATIYSDGTDFYVAS